VDLFAPGVSISSIGHTSDTARGVVKSGALSSVAEYLGVHICNKAKQKGQAERPSNSAGCRAAQLAQRSCSVGWCAEKLPSTLTLLCRLTLCHFACHVHSHAGTSMSTPFVAGVAARIIASGSCGSAVESNDCVYNTILSQATLNIVTNSGARTPNRLLHRAASLP
jgi:subtilisin family serine protease